MSAFDAIRDHQSGIIRTIAQSFKKASPTPGFETDDDLIKSWSTELRDSNQGSRWVTMSGSHVLLGSGGEVLAAHSKMKGKMLGKKAAAFVSEARGDDDKKPSAPASEAAPAKAAGEEGKKPKKDYDKLNANQAERKGLPGSKAAEEAKKEATEKPKDEPEATAPKEEEKPKQEPKAEAKEAEKPTTKAAEEHLAEYHGEKDKKPATYQPGEGPSKEEAAKEAEAKKERIQQSAKDFLESDLSNAKKPEKGKHIDRTDLALGGEINPQSIASAPAKAIDEVEGLKKVVSTDDLRPAMTGVYFDDKHNQLVATNGNMLVVIPKSKAEMGQNAGKIIDPKTGKVPAKLEEGGRFPEYTGVIPEPYESGGNIQNINGLRDKLSGMIKANTQIGDSKYKGPDGTQYIRAEVKLGDKYSYYDPKYLKDAIDALQGTGTKNMRIELPDKAGRAAFIRDADNPKKFAMIMPILNSTDDDARFGGGSVANFNKAPTMPHSNVADFDDKGNSIGPDLQPATKAAPKPRAEKPAADPRGDFYAGVPQGWAPGADIDYHKVAGEPVAELADKGDFVVHKQVLAGGKVSSKYIVSEGKTGTTVGNAAKSKEEAIESAKERMKNYNKAGIDDLVESLVAKNAKNISPRYANEKTVEPAAKAPEAPATTSAPESTAPTLSGSSKSLDERRAARAARGSEADVRYNQVIDSLTGGSVDKTALKNEAKYTGYEKTLSNSAINTKEQLDKVVKELEDAGSFHPKTNEEGDFNPENLTEQEREIHTIASDIAKKLEGKTGNALSAAVLESGGDLYNLSQLGSKDSSKPGAKRFDFANDTASDINYHLQDGLHAARKMAKMQTKSNAYTSSAEKSSMQDMFGSSAATLPSTKEAVKPQPNAKVEAPTQPTVGKTTPAKPGTAPKKEAKAAPVVDNTPKPYAGAWDGKDIAINDPKASDKLSDKIDKLQRFQDTMTAANKLVRKNDTEGLKKLGYDDGQIAKLMKNGHDNKPQGHRSWELSNNNATISQAKKRLEEVNKRSTMESSSTEKHGVGVEHDIEGNRTRLRFPGKPGPTVRADLKASGFRWAPSEGAWQAYHSEHSKYSADRILDKYKDNFEKGDAYEDESGLDTIQKALADSQLIIEHSF